MSLSLYVIDRSLSELMDAREELLAQDPLANPDHAAELEAVEALIRQYAEEKLPAKVDSIIWWRTQARAAAAQAREEAAAMLERARLIEANVKRLDEQCIEVMGERKHLEGTAGRKLCRQGNGGLAPLVVDGWDGQRWKIPIPEAPLPNHFMDITGSMPTWVWNRMFSLAREHDQEFFSDLCQLRDWVITPSNKRIREALAEPCERCGGTGEESIDIVDERGGARCWDCAGTSKRVIPGARLGDRGQQVRVR